MIYPDLKTCNPFFIKAYRIPRNIVSIFNNSFYIYSCSEIKMIEKCRIEDTHINIFKREEVPVTFCIGIEASLEEYFCKFYA